MFSVKSGHYFDNRESTGNMNTGAGVCHVQNGTSQFLRVKCWVHEGVRSELMRARLGAKRAKRNCWAGLVVGCWRSVVFVSPSGVPYPDPYQPPIVVVPQTTSPPTATSQFWYYCPSSNGYSPYVSQCLESWQKVPVTAPPDVPR